MDIWLDIWPDSQPDIWLDILPDIQLDIQPDIWPDIWPDRYPGSAATTRRAIQTTPTRTPRWGADQCQPPLKKNQSPIFFKFSTWPTRF